MSVDLGQFVSIITGGSGATVLAVMFWLIVIKRKLITIDEHEGAVGSITNNYEARIKEIREAHDTHLGLIRDQLRLAEEDASRWETIALQSTGIVAATVKAVAS